MPGNIAQFFSAHLATPQHVLYREFTGGAWKDVTAADLASRIARWQAAFRREGYRAGERVALCARNSVEWVAVDLAALGLGLVVVPLYADDNADNIAWCAANAEARLLVVENSRLAAHLRSISDQGPLPPLCVLDADDGETAAVAAQWLPSGQRAVEVASFPDAALATICYTSGTAGRPKGVMLSHGNIVANVRQCEATGMARRDDRFLSILPLSHMFERTGGYYLPLALGAVVAHARGIARLGEDMLSQRPTVVFAVPRILERFLSRIEQAMRKSRWKAVAFDACVRRGARLAQGKATTLDRVAVPLLRAWVGSAVLAQFGGCLRLSVVGGAALDPALVRAFSGLGLPLLQGYGMTEASPVIAVNRLEDIDAESVGPALPGIEVRLTEAGELLARGPNVMPGYWRNEAATRAVVDADGWLHTGDLAEIRAGKIVIRGRAKDIFVMSNGEKLPPQDVELAILRDPVFEHVMLIGDGRAYPILLAVTREADEKLLVKRANAQLKAFPRWAKVRRVIATPTPWTIENGLMTPTLKLKRNALIERFQAQIAAAYEESPPD